MKAKIRIIFQRAGKLFLLFLIFLVPSAAVSQPQNIDIADPGVIPPHTFNLNVGTPFNSTIGVLNATGNVFWDFTSTPVPASPDGSSFTHMGITVTLPAGAPGSSVPQTETVNVQGNPTTSGSFSFTLTVLDENDNTLSQNRVYEVLISLPMDLVLVFDRSGSMNTPTSAGVTRWDALESAAANFGNMYQALDRPDDRLSITYFETDLLPASACCNTFVAFDPAIGTTISNDLAANSPGGSTAMGTGLQNAQSKLSDATRARSILLFTDGQQNQSPMVDIDGQGYSDGSSIPGGASPGGIKIATIGIGGPGGAFHTTLQNLALNNRGSFNTTDDGTAFLFVGGNASGDLSSGFTDQFVTMLSEFSPQLIGRSSTNVASGTAPFTLQSFPVNKRVDKLLLEFVFDRKFEIPVQLLSRIQVLKDGIPVTQHARPSWVGNYTNTLLLTFDFNNSQDPEFGGAASLDPEGNWTVQLADVSNLRIGHCNLTVLADDHRLHIRRSLGNPAPKVGDSFPVMLTLDWLGYPIENASVEAFFFRPGEDLGHFLATNPLTVDVSDSLEGGSPGLQKYEQLWATDSVFRASLERTENVISLNHSGDGKYEGSFNGLTVSGVYKVLFRISGNHPDVGEYQRILSESFYTSFSDVDLSQSVVSSQIVNGQLIMQIRPKTSYGMFVGPAMGNAFSISGTAVKISNVEDHQDGNYTITFTGDIGSPVTLDLLGQDIYTGKLEDAGKSGSIIDKIQKWLESIGLPGWLIWIIMLVVVAVAGLFFRKKKKSP